MRPTQKEVATLVLDAIAGKGKTLSDRPQRGRDPGVSVQIDSTGCPRVDVDDYAALVRVVGLVRHKWHDRIILYRLQPQCHGKMAPSAFRDDKSAGRIGRSARSVNAAVNRMVAAVQSAQPKGEGARAEYRATTEPVLQHYGLHTRWLDLVDSIPHAVFFSVNAQCALVPDGSVAYTPSPRFDGVIYLLDIGADDSRRPAFVRESGSRRRAPGLWTVGRGTQLCDLRRAKPSNATRPHAQHGYLFRCVGETDYWSRVICRIFVPTARAVTWVGGEALSLRELFPQNDGYLRGLRTAAVTAAIEDAERRSGFGLGEVQRFAHHRIKL